MTIDLAVATFHLTMMDNGPEKPRGIEPLRLHAAVGEKDRYIQIYVACQDIWTRLSVVKCYKLSQNRLEVRTVTAVVIDLACLRVRKRCFLATFSTFKADLHPRKWRRVIDLFRSTDLHLLSRSACVYYVLKVQILVLCS